MGRIVSIVVVLVIVVGAYMYFSGGAPEETVESTEAPAAEAPATDAPAEEAPAADAGSSN